MMKARRTVTNKYPAAQACYDFDGNCTIMVDGMDLCEEFFMPVTSDESKAWEYAALSIRTKQNFDRTHPNRMDLESIESRMSRLDKRKKKKKNGN